MANGQATVDDMGAGLASKEGKAEIARQEAEFSSPKPSEIITPELFLTSQIFEISSHEGKSETFFVVSDERGTLFLVE